ncbi:hypothetical protein C900_04367 [Fulvivirga imtechensis AK7]|uniref:Uncharacterized protein n=1 Tax=Fulvivirga imtechensis AK7 TaxID=1237149 RepID=L8JXJ6_9BACT|nr:HNH endonuclease [Fulvivirga imtechensis]ELR73515.1 hypothetical protein C900_04367 [Fulvivirga imtechensis AK7]
MAKKDTREKLFKLFSANLNEVKRHASISLEPDFEDGYICPLCFDVFFCKDLSNASKNPLTLEDVPPKSLGGNPKTLTCRECNSKSGHELDTHLLIRLNEIDARNFAPNSKYRTTFSKDGNKINGLIEVDNNGELSLYLEPKISNPDEVKKFMNEVFPTRTIYNPLLNPDKMFDRYNSETFNIKLPDQSNERRAEIAILRAGYLLAFSILGNAFLINSGLYKVREQILNPDQIILQYPFWIKYEFPEEMLGLNIISSPKELGCYLMIFNLKTKSSKKQFAIALPGPSSPGIGVYKNIDSFLYQDGDGFQNLQLVHIPDFAFVRNTQNAWGAHLIWQKYFENGNKSG